MKHSLLLTLLLLFCGVIQSQEQEVVVIDGVTFSADLKTLIKYPVDKTGKEYVVPEGTEVIGKKAFESAKVNKVTLPTTLTHINDSAFYHFGDLYLVLTGKFPIIGNRILNKDAQYIVVSPDNSYCYESEDGFIYSMDGKTLYFAPREVMIYYYEQQIEIIDRYAFQDSYFRWGDVDVPSSVLLIREHAFDDIKANLPTRSISHAYPFQFSCKALVPPELEGEVFNESGFGNSTLYVPKELVELYKDTPQWNTFGFIKGINSNPPDGITENTACSLRISSNSGHIYLEAQKTIHSICLISLSGGVVYNEVLSNSDQTSYSIACSNEFTGLLQVIYKDESASTIKLSM